MTTSGDNDFASAVKAWRISKGLSVEAAAAMAEVAPGTWRSAEKGKRTRDLSRGPISTLIGFGEAPAPISAEDASDFAGITREQLSGDLAGFSDAELFHELQLRSLLMAATLTALGVPNLAWRVSDEGWDEVTSRAPGEEVVSAVDDVADLEANGES